MPSIVLTKRRCRRCGRFKTRSTPELCLRCLAVASIATESATAGASGVGSVTTDFGRFRADLGLDTILPQDPENRNFSGPLDPDAVDVAGRAASGGQPIVVQPPLPGFLNSPSRPPIDTVLPRSPGLLPRPSRRDGASKSVLTRIGPIATEQLVKERSGTGKARRLWADVRRVARPIAIGVVLISVSAALGAAVPLLLSLLGR